VVMQLLLILGLPLPPPLPNCALLLWCRALVDSRTLPQSSSVDGGKSSRTENGSKQQQKRRRKRDVNQCHLLAFRPFQNQSPKTLGAQLRMAPGQRQRFPSHQRKHPPCSIPSFRRFGRRERGEEATTTKQFCSCEVLLIRMQADEKRREDGAVLWVERENIKHERARCIWTAAYVLLFINHT